MVNESKQILERLSGGAEPTEAERQLLQSEAAPAAPSRESMLAAAVARAADERGLTDNSKEHYMNWFNRILSRHSGYSRLGIAAAVFACALAAVALLAALPTSPGFAATDGYVLQYSGTISVDESELKSLADKVQAEVRRIKEEYAATDPSVLEKKNVVMRIEASHDSEDGPMKWVIVVGLTEDNPGFLEALREGLSSVSGLGTAEVTPNTWFGPEGQDLAGDGINLTLNADGEERQFSFPASATEEEIEETLRRWMAEKHPGEEFNVDVTIERNGDEVKIGVKLLGPEKP